MSNETITFLEIRLGKFLCFFFTVIRRFSSIFYAPSISPASCKVVFVKFIEQGALVLHHATFSEAAHRYGAENIFIVTFRSNQDLLEILGDFIPENRIYLDEKNIPGFIFSFFDAIRAIRRHQIDSLIDLDFFSCATAVFSYLTGAHKRIGYHRYEGGQNYRGDLFTHMLNYSPYLSIGESGWCMLECLSGSSSDYPALPAINFPNFRKHPFTPTEEDIAHLHGLFADNISMTDMVVINPSFRDVLPLRAWPEGHYVNFIKKILDADKKLSIVLTGRADEYEYTDGFLKQFGKVNAINLCGKTTLRDLFTLYAASKLLLTSDSGPAHFASLTDIPAIVLFGPETPVLYAPKGPHTHVIYKHLPCSPCYNVYNNRISTCKNNLCLKSITVDEVLKLALEIKKK